MQLPAAGSKSPTVAVAGQNGLAVIEQTWPRCYVPIGGLLVWQAQLFAKTGTTASDGEQVEKGHAERCHDDREQR